MMLSHLETDYNWFSFNVLLVKRTHRTSHNYFLLAWVISTLEKYFTGKNGTLSR